MGVVAPFPQHNGPNQVVFIREELSKIMDIYGRMVAAGKWRDYAIVMERDYASFSAFRRSAENPEYRVEKRPSLHMKQGMWALFNENGMILKRGAELSGVLAPLERKLIKAING
ncbi:hypothetical protein LPB140_04605 [Sphingorhabdus lutea]|uniref:DUF2794 domain-containing protein n=1 Tax=Sphingorhabdus lutea TaxID=1913578 RepID=A0A1L3JAP1_9SPHN|nr:DUF2794 domain-containing protein [Sphingorhabdus lutea]APG62204.1 hypothetical protein LPB140_04605 [Sphingorhabdus lutea]